MREIAISDVTMKQIGKASGLSLSFREKIEIAKLLDKLGVSVIELSEIVNPKVDSLLIKSISSAVSDSIIAVPVAIDGDNIKETWNALKEAKHPRLQLCAPVSAVQMEYLSHKKPDAMLVSIKNTITLCKEYCGEVEFIADDATRSDDAFLYEAIKTAVESGANTITICDTAGKMLADEFADFIASIYENVPSLKDVRLGVSCSNALAMADACAVTAIRSGAVEVMTTACDSGIVSLGNIANIISAKGDGFDAKTTVKMTQLNRILNQIIRMCESSRSETSPYDNSVRNSEGEFMISAYEDRAAVMKVVERLGYDLSEEDAANVYDEFKKIAAKKESVTSAELDAIVASTALQVPPTYKLETYVVNTGNNISAMAHLKISRRGEMMEGIAIGDGPIDAAFLAVAQVVGARYELDEFQIRAVTEGHEAMGETIVKLRANGKIYSGRGISTDIVGSGILAYINALNKIVYEEETV
ncbi:MAG: hypothetical protein E7218_06665 [Anaerofustis stercorihominis]|nr:hypothetical protein [Anaerofustis stercorihominis]